MTTATQFVKLRVEERVAVITIDNPPVNALNTQTMTELHAAFMQANEDDAVKAIVLTGNGMAFVAGADINEIAQISSADLAVELVTKGQGLLSFIEGLRKPVIAAINGVALGGGLELAMACHVRYISDRAKLALPEITLGIIPGFGGTQRLSRIVGPAKATEMMLTGEMITAQEAFRVGLVNKVVPEGDVVKQALGLAKKISGFGKHAIAGILEAVDQGRNSTLEEGLKAEAQIFGCVSQTADMKEGTSAFKEKRRPNFQDK